VKRFCSRIPCSRIPCAARVRQGLRAWSSYESTRRSTRNGTVVKSRGRASSSTLLRQRDFLAYGLSGSSQDQQIRVSLVYVHTVYRASHIGPSDAPRIALIGRQCWWGVPLNLRARKIEAPQRLRGRRWARIRDGLCCFDDLSMEDNMLMRHSPKFGGP